MITHFAELRLPTVSISGTKQVYNQRLGLPVADESSDQISFSLTAFTRLSFFLSDKPLAPVHFAIQVPYSRFYESADLIRRSGLLIAAWPTAMKSTKPRSGAISTSGTGTEIWSSSSPIPMFPKM